MSETNNSAKEIQEELKESVHKVWLAGLGALSVAEEEGTRVFKTLVEKGEKFEDRGKQSVSKVASKVKDSMGKVAGQARDQASESWERFEDRVDDAVTSAFQKVGVPSREEIATLTKRVEELTAVVEKLQKGPTKVAATRKGPAKTAKKATPTAAKASLAKK